MTRSPGTSPRESIRRRAIVVMAALGLAAAISAVVFNAASGASTADARWREVEEDVRDRIGAALERTSAVASAIAGAPAVPRALVESGAGRQDLFAAIEETLSPGRQALAVTIYDPGGTARAWHGRASEFGATTDEPARFFATGGPLGFRIARLEPIIDPASGRRVGAAVVEEIVSEDRVGGFTSDVFRLQVSAGLATIGPAPGRSGGRAQTTIQGPGGEPLVLVYREDPVLDAAIARDRAHAAAIALVSMALALLFVSGVMMDRRAHARSPGAHLRATAALVLVLAGVRALLWFATPALRGAALFQPAAERTAGLFLRSPADLCLSGALWLGLSALLADVSGRARVAWRTRRRWPHEAYVPFGASQIVAALVSFAALAASDAILQRAVDLTGAEALSFSLYPVAIDRIASLFGLILVQAGALWTAVAALMLGLAPWRAARRGADALAVILLWGVALAIVAAGMAVRPGGDSSLTFFLAAVAAMAAGLFAPRVATRYRRAGASARLLALAAAVLFPALVAYPSVLQASQERLRTLVERDYSQAALRHWTALQDALTMARHEIDRIPALPDLVQRPAGPSSIDEAFAVWSETALARARLTSSVELYGPGGNLVSRFALNFPEYEASAQVTQSETCAWRVFAEARPFGAAERAALHAERAVCAADGARLGSIVVHVMLDYDALPFISSDSPYREVFRQQPARDSRARQQIDLVIYGWSLLPIYTSGVQLWPISEALFSRIYRSRDGFWAELESRGEVHHVYFVNDRQGVYALGYPALGLFDHLVHLAELATLGALVYVLGVVVIAVFNRAARIRPPAGRALLRDIRASFYRKLLIAFVLASVIPVLALALVIRTYFASRLRADVNAEAARTATVAQHALDELSALLRLAGLAAPPVNDDLMVEVSQMIGRDVNVFEGPSLVATSQRDLFASGLLPTRTPEDVYRDIILERRPTSVGQDVVGDVGYMVAAAPVTATGRDAIVTVPLASRQREIEREIDELDRGLLLAVVVFVLVGAAIGLPTAERIADPVRRLTRAARRIARGDFDTRVAVRSADELRRLVDAFNSMAAELKAQRQQLERTHRLEAWAEMARQVAHEIKNPLTPIQLSAEHLRRVHRDRGEPLSPVLDGCVDSILGQVRLLRQIAGEFSSFASSPTARPSRVRVRELIEEVTIPYRTGLEGRIDLQIEIDDGVPEVAADRTLVGRALTNIIDNALHAMPGRGGLHVSAEARAGTVAIAVRDTGVGMDEEALARLFEPYFSTKATGTGLGLTIARRNVELSGGSIDVTSVRGQGTTVTITLPAADA